MPAGFFSSMFYFSNVFSTVVARAPIFPPSRVGNLNPPTSFGSISSSFFPAKNNKIKAEKKKGNNNNNAKDSLVEGVALARRL